MFGERCTHRVNSATARNTFFAHREGYDPSPFNGLADYLFSLKEERNDWKRFSGNDPSFDFRGRA
jgi:hypothetical protein